METLIAILRGINVSGQRKVPMVELKELFEGLKFKEVTTYIQSGNVVFKSTTAPKNLHTKIEKEINIKFGFDVPVLIRSLSELKTVLKKNPFLKKKGVSADKLHVTFLGEVPAKENLEKIKAYNYKPDEFIIVGKEVYLHCPVSYGTTKLSNTFFENKLKVRATTRNWKTINELVRIAEAP